jgi:DUF4097 and DUF4098 domain-containing protein YvlB
MYDVMYDAIYVRLSVTCFYDGGVMMLKGFGKVVDGIKKGVQGVVSPASQFKEELSWDLEGDGVTLINARTQSGTLELQGTDQTVVTVKAEKRVYAPTDEEAEAFAQQVEVNVNLEGDQVIIGTEYPETPPDVSVSVSFKVTAPQSVATEFKTGSGDIEVSEVEGNVTANAGSGSLKIRKCKNTLDLQTGSGEIGVAECEGMVNVDSGSGGIKVQKHVGSANLHTASGKIRVTGIEGDLKATSDSGGITVRRSTGPLDLHALSGRISADQEALAGRANFKTSSGSINVKLGEGTAPVVASTNSGTITFSLPVDFTGELDAKTASGTIRCQFSLIADEKVKGHLKGRIGEGKGATLNLQTSSGNINVTAQGKLEIKV